MIPNAPFGSAASCQLPKCGMISRNRCSFLVSFGSGGILQFLGKHKLFQVAICYIFQRNPRAVVSKWPNLNVILCSFRISSNLSDFCPSFRSLFITPFLNTRDKLSTHPLKSSSNQTVSTFEPTMGASIMLVAMGAAAMVLAQSNHAIDSFAYQGCSSVDMSCFTSPVALNGGPLTPEMCQKACQGHLLAALFPT